MILNPILNQSEVEEAYNRFSTIMGSRGQQVTTNIGHMGDNFQADVRWDSENGIWWCLWGVIEGNRYWCAYGTENPSEKKRNLNIVCEINFPIKGILKNIGGAFARNGNNQIFITHNGSLRGGRPGISKHPFLRTCNDDQFVDLEGNNICDKVLLISDLESPLLFSRIASFVRQVEAFKASINSGGMSLSILPELGSYTPEFSGKKKGYRIDNSLQATCNHGPVVDALHKELKNRKFTTGNDQGRDLFLIGEKGRMETLFEVKTNLSTSSIYCAIGQLLFHGIVQKPPPKLVFVSLGNPSDETRNILNQLAIDVLRYEQRRNGTVVFHNLDQVLARSR